MENMQGHRTLSRTLPPALVRRLRALAQKYEDAGFLRGDPAQFMHRYAAPRDQEVAAFLAASLAFGRREQILAHVERILAQAGTSPADWIADGGYRRFFPRSDASFYRMFSHAALRRLCGCLRAMLAERGTLGAFFREAYRDAAGGAVRAGASPGPRSAVALERAPAAEACLGSGGRTAVPHLSAVIAAQFPADCAIIPHGRGTAAKRLQMFLRWMVRDGSPVDVGLWAGWYDKDALLMPLDTHVMQQAVALGLLPAAPSGRPPAPSLRTAVALTDTLRQAFPGDPVRGDYALFGLGADGVRAAPRPS